MMQDCSPQYHMFTYGLQMLGLMTAWNSTPDCKTVPGSKLWPSNDEWSSLNQALSGRLIKPSPPGAVCHPTPPTFDPVACPAVVAGWHTTQWHSDDPVSVSENNLTNDTCLSIPMAPCSSEGYPIYVVNATCTEDVKLGVDFARKYNIRLIVKGTGHDYMGRLVIPNISLVIQVKKPEPVLLSMTIYSRVSSLGYL
jgi:hypothetical protein